MCILQYVIHKCEIVINKSTTQNREYLRLLYSDS